METINPIIRKITIGDLKQGVDLPGRSKDVRRFSKDNSNNTRRGSLV